MIARVILDRPVAAAGSGSFIWVVGGETPTLTRHQARTGQVEARVTLDATPITLSASRDLLAVAAADRTIRGLDAESGAERWRCATADDVRAVRVVGTRVWVALANDSLAWFEGPIMGGAFAVPGLVQLAPAPGGPDAGVYHLSAGGALALAGADGRIEAETRIADDARPFGALAFCANGVWLSTPDSLLLFEPRSLQRKARVPAPEGPVEQLIGDENMRLYGGSHGVFVLNPAADVMVRPLPVPLASPLRALAAAVDTLWAIESAAPIVHVVDTT